jgi:hypothetical protein
MMSHVKPTRDGNAVRNRYGEVKGISRAWGEIFTGVENKLQQKRLVEGRIINHESKFSTLLGRREGVPSFFL